MDQHFGIGHISSDRVAARALGKIVESRL
jgi:hypothetical protein